MLERRHALGHSAHMHIVRTCPLQQSNVTVSRATSFPSMALPRSALDGEEVQYEGQKVVFMQFAFLRNIKHAPGKGEFHSLWGGHWAKVVRHEPIFLNVSGFGGSFKYYYLNTTEANGLTMKVYHHCADRYRPVGIVVHTSFPAVVVNSEVLEHENLPIKVIHWTYATTGSYMWSKFLWSDDA